MKFIQSVDLGNDQIEILLEFFESESLDETHITDALLLSKIARQILRGLSYLHKRGIAHNDIRPASVLMGARHKVKIMDFVVNKFKEKCLAYVSPDYLSRNFEDSDGLIDECSGDIWGFGLTMLEIYMGKFPLPVKNMYRDELMVEIFLISPPPEAPPTASEGLRDFIDCCLQKEARRRWTAEQLLQHAFILKGETSDEVDDNDELIPNQNPVVNNMDLYSRREPFKLGDVPTKHFSHRRKSSPPPSDSPSQISGATVSPGKASEVEVQSSKIPTPRKETFWKTNLKED